MTRQARGVLWTLQVTVLALPLFLGGRQPVALVSAWLVVSALLVITVRARRHAGRPAVPGSGVLAAFVGLGLITVLPLPPALLDRLAPATAQLYRDVLPGWPGGGGWSTWRSLAIDPYAVCTTLSTLAVGFGVYMVLAGYPWGDETARARAFGRVFLAMLGAGAVLALLALFQEVAGNGHVLWITDEDISRGRVSGPFVNPNHLACWLEMIIPAGAAYAWSLGERLRRRITKSVDSGRRLGLRPRRAWIGALIASQRRLVIPFVAAAAVALMVTAHFGTQSRGGLAALLVGLGVTSGGLLARAARRRGGRVPRWIPTVAALALFGAGALAIGLWARSDGDAIVGADQVDVSFAGRLAVGLQGIATVRDHPFLGTGLGSWLHVFRGYVVPPVEGGIWDHAHDEYLELAAETGFAGMALAACFGLAIGYAIRRGRRGGAMADARRERRDRSLSDPPEWRTALGEHRTLAWGIAGGVAAALVHSLVEFGLHMPANFALLMSAIALLVLALPAREARTSFGIAAFAVLALVAAVPVGWNAFLVVSGRTPLSPDDALAAADRAFSEEGDGPRATALVIAAIDHSPAYRDAHEMLATVVGPGQDGDDALRRALHLEPWYAPGRDELAFRLWRRGETEAAAATLEESFYRLPCLISHAFLGPDAPLTSAQGPYVVRALADGDELGVRLAILEPPLSAAIERGLDRALLERPAGEERAAIVADRVALLEAAERWTEAADTLRAEAGRDERDDESLGHAARNYLKASDPVRAEEALLAALLRNPERGSLYQRLAVDVYVPRGEFVLAEKVIEAGERNAVDMIPIYSASSDVIAKREQAWTERMAMGAQERP
jgi:O-Antigen ligase